MGAPAKDQWDANRNIDTTKGPNYKVSSRAAGSEGYKPTKTDMGPTYDSKPQLKGNYPEVNTSRLYDSEDQSKKAPNYTVEKKETATGSLSTKSEKSSSDRMSWAREAERKARKLMGGR